MGIIKNVREKTEGLIDYLKEEPLCITYPILGNLSPHLQDKIEEITHEKYNAQNAFFTSFIANTLVYPISLSFLFGQCDNNPAPFDIFGAFAGIFYASFESVLRLLYGFRGASILGEIFSLPYTIYLAHKYTQDSRRK